MTLLDLHFHHFHPFYLIYHFHPIHPMYLYITSYGQGSLPVRVTDFLRKM